MPEIGIPCHYGIGEQIDKEFTKPFIATAKSAECEARCVATFVTPGLEDAISIALNEGAKRVAKRAADETAKMAIKAVAKRANFIITVYAASVAVDCIVRCQNTNSCSK
jgi:hypothetical protein